MPKPRKPLTRVQEPASTYQTAPEQPTRTPPILQPQAAPQTYLQQRPTKRLATPGSFKPGQSGNPAGRPKKGQSLKEIIRSWAEKNATKIEKELDRHAFQQHRWDSLQWALEWYLGKPAVVVERSEDERHLAWAELQTKLLERWNVRLQGSSDIPQLTQGEIPPEDPQP